MTPEQLSSAESMAIAVLRGDLAAARALADMLVNECKDGLVPVPSIRRLTTDVRRLRFLVQTPSDRPSPDHEHIQRCLHDWLATDSSLITMPDDWELHVYELPPALEIESSPSPVIHIAPSVPIQIDPDMGPINESPLWGGPEPARPTWELKDLP